MDFDAAKCVLLKGESESPKAQAQTSPASQCHDDLILTLEAPGVPVFELQFAIWRLYGLRPFGFVELQPS